jgi:hypothetical protein
MHFISFLFQSLGIFMVDMILWGATAILLNILLVLIYRALDSQGIKKIFYDKMKDQEGIYRD